MHRFFLPREAIQREGEVLFPEETSHQIRRVLRLKPGSRVVVLDNQGWEYGVELIEVDQRQAGGKVLEKREAAGEPHLKVDLYIGLTQREKFEWVLQKCTEAGVSRFWPILTARSLVRDEGEVQSKYGRWEKILREAAEQCGRGLIPELMPPTWLEKIPAPEAQFRFIPWEDEKGVHMNEELKAVRVLYGAQNIRVAIMIGPEGGFEKEEVEAATGMGFKAVTLGSRIFRMETAAIAAVLLAFFEFGELG